MKFLRVLGTVVIACISVACLALVFLPHILGYVVNNQITAIKEKSQPVRTSELAGPRIPEDENAAVLYTQAFELLSDSDAKQEVDSAADVLSWEDGRNPSDWDAARRVTARYREALLLAERGAARPKCRFETNWDEGGIDVEFPYIPGIRRLVRLAAMGAVVEARDGRMGQAVRWLDLSYKLGQALRDEPSLVGELARDACVEVSSCALQDVLNSGPLTEDQAQTLIETISPINPYSGFHVAMQGERAMGLDVLERVRRDGPGVLEEITGGTESFTGSVGSQGWSATCRACADELYYLDLMNRKVETAGFSYRQAVEVGLDAKPKFPRYAIGTAIVSPVLTRARAERDEAAARLGGDLIALALATHHYLFGEYPQTLDDLQSGLTWKQPSDPFSGEPFIYARQGNGFVLYSVGRDLENDSATPLRPEQVEAIRASADDEVTADCFYRDPTGWAYTDMVWRVGTRN